MKNSPKQNIIEDEGQIRIANFMDSPLAALEQKGNLATAPGLYNPFHCAEKVLHFTPEPVDVQYQDAFKTHNIEIVPLLRLKSRRLIAFPKALHIAWQNIRKNRINVIRCRLPYYGGFIGGICGKLLRIPVIVSLGGNNRLPQQMGKRYYYGSKHLSYGIEKAVLLMADRIIVPNNYTADYVKTIIGADPATRKCVRIPWIIDLEEVEDTIDRGELEQRFGMQPDKQLILIVGHINKYKFSDVMFDVISWMTRVSDPGFQFIFCGDGPLKAVGEDRFAANPYVLFIGWQEHKMVQALLRIADIVAIPMSGFVLLEAAYFGRPVISSNIEWHSELVTDRVSGRLVDPAEVDAWVEAIGEMAGDVAQSQEYGKRLKEKFDAEYNPDFLRHQEIELYRTVIGERRRG